MTTTIVITCPKCKKQMKAPAEIEGKRIKCKPCGTVFVAGSSTAGSVPAGRTAVPQKTAPARKPAPKAPEPEAEPLAAPASEAEGDDDGGTYSVQDFDVGTLTAQPKPKQDEPEAPPAKRPAFDDDDPNPYDVTTLDLTPRCPHCAAEMESEESVVCLHCGYNVTTRELGKTIRSFAHTPFEIFMWLLPGIICFLVSLSCVVIMAIHWFAMSRLTASDPEAWWAIALNHLFAKLYATVFFCFIGWRTGKYAVKRLVKEPRPPEKIKR